MLPVRDHLRTRVVPFVNYALIAANVVVFLFEAQGFDLAAWALVPARFLADPLHESPRLLTHMFLHGSVAHLGGNMLYLWIFGDNVEDVLGHARYAAFYLLCGVVAALAQIAASAGGGGAELAMVGASGAIAGVLAAYAILYPTSQITVVNPIPILWLFWGLFLSFPAWLVVLEFFAVNLYSAFTEGTSAGVAFVAHVGGFVAGAALLPLLRQRPRLEYESWGGWRRGAGVTS